MSPKKTKAKSSAKKVATPTRSARSSTERLPSSSEELSSKSSSKSASAELSKFTILTLFPDAIDPYLNTSLLGRARKNGLAHTRTIQIRDFSTDKHRSVDGPPFGGGEGMVLRADVLTAALEGAKKEIKAARLGVIYLSPQGRVLTQKLAKEISQKYDHAVLVCGHYEGVDERFIEASVTEEISIGDYVLTGGELPALVLMDALARLIPGVVQNPSSVSHDSFEDGLLKYPQYTKPRVFEGRGNENKEVPEVLLGGNHKKIAEWRKAEQLKRTALKRPDLLRAAVQSRVAEINIYVKDLDRAKLFIEEVLKLKVIQKTANPKRDDYFFVDTRSDVNWVVMKAEKPQTVCLSLVATETLENLMLRLRHNRVSIVGAGIQTVPEGRFLQFKDSDENVFEFIDGI